MITRKSQTTVVTSCLNIQYQKPVYATDKLLTICTSIVSKMRNYHIIQVELTNEKGELCDDVIYYAKPQDKATEIGCRVEEEL